MCVCLWCSFVVLFFAFYFCFFYIVFLDIHLLTLVPEDSALKGEKRFPANASHTGTRTSFTTNVFLEIRNNRIGLVFESQFLSSEVDLWEHFSNNRKPVVRTLMNCFVVEPDDLTPL